MYIKACRENQISALSGHRTLTRKYRYSSELWHESIAIDIANVVLVFQNAFAGLGTGNPHNLSKYNNQKQLARSSQQCLTSPHETLKLVSHVAEAF